MLLDLIADAMSEALSKKHSGNSYLHRLGSLFVLVSEHSIEHPNHLGGAFPVSSLAFTTLNLAFVNLSARPILKF